jgi:hypothetical protein
LDTPVIAKNHPSLIRSSVLFSFVAVMLFNMAGCGGNGDQRKSGTLVTPIDAVEQAGEQAGKAEDAKKTPKQK